MVFKIFKRDIKKIFTNSMAIILAVGIAVLPSLYAWINIYANWDPYGKESTGNMEIAVVIDDKGYQYNDLTINVGEEIKNNLKANDTINWQFVSKSKAVNGVESGKYYAAIVIPSGFSKSLTSIVSDNFKQPQITYYANEKKNAIATKITDKVVQTVQNEVNVSFVTTVVNVLNSLLGTVVEEAQTGSNSTLESLNEQIKSAKKSIEGVQKTLDGFDEVMKITKDLNDALSDKNIKSLLNNADKTITSTQDVITVTRESVGSITSSLGVVLDKAADSLNSSADTVDSVSSMTVSKATAKLTKVSTDLSEIHGKLSTCIDALTKINSALPKPLKSIDKVLTDLKAIDTKITGTIESINKAIASKDFTNAAKGISTDLRALSASIKSVKTNYTDNVKPAIDKSINSLVAVLGDMSNLVNSISGDVPTMNTMVETLNGSLNAGSDMITSVSQLLDSCESQLDSLSSKIKGLSDSKLLNTVYNITSDNDNLGEFIACPVEVKTEKVYGIDNYGSAMAPFYSTLAIWVGAIILVAIFNTKVKNKKELGNVGTVQEYFGRGLTFMFFSLIQGIIICLGDLYFLNIQCYHPMKFIFATVAASLIFSMFVYSLVAAFGDVGKAVAVIMLVVQLGGSGGTFPIDVTPSFFRSINPYLPFTFVINAMRECVCGTWANDYWIDLLKLCAYIPISLIIGLFFRFLFKKPIKFFNRRIERTGMF